MGFSYYLKKIDVIYSSPIKIWIKDFDTYRTTLGGVLTIVTMIILTWFGIIFSIEYFSKRRLFIDKKEIYNNNPPLIDLNPHEDFMFAVKVF